MWYNCSIRINKTAQVLLTPNAVSNHERDWLSMATSHYTANDIQRFWAKVDKSSGEDACWLWTASLDHQGYGKFGVKSATQIASRVAYRLEYGEIPDGLWVLHNCPDGDNRACVNPAHLYLGTAHDNNVDTHEKGRAVHPHGEQHERAKLTAADVLAIRQRYTQGGVSYGDLASEYGIARATIQQIIERRTWKSVGERHDN